VAEVSEVGTDRPPRPLRIVFVCTQNKLRSPTAEAIFRDTPGWEVASAGTDNTAETPLTRDLLDWADVAVCMQKQHRDWIRTKLKGALPDDCLLVLGIPDDYEYMDAVLMELLKKTVPLRLETRRPRSV
jgi:predicted protein tyrosine phosphatase